MRVMPLNDMVFFMETTNLIGTAEVARRMGKSHRTVHRLVTAGALVPVMTTPGGFKGAYLFDANAVEQYIAGTAA